MTLTLVLASFFFVSTQAQIKKASKYNSLLWEITGNGLKKPSYLFGTMHVSSKMVFHLSDSFYQAIQSADVVALELNPQKWQPEMFRMSNAEKDIMNFTSRQGDDYINEESFRLQKYEDKIKLSLSEEPTLINGLLYRTYQPRADFEENTYLDLYIYQTGRKLGKIPAGVEDYYEMQKLTMEAYQEMAMEKNRKQIDLDGESIYDIQKKIQDAYRKGDLDLLDSLQTITETSAAFNEKFLYKRNENQANAIDSIIRKQSLFVGVGAAHLPGQRGVIELLRKKGYKLRPIVMRNRDAVQKEKIDKMKVPVQFNTVTTIDGFVKVAAPGQLFRRTESKVNDSWQYADMENGSYYMLTKVKTHAALHGHNEATVLKKVDSLLYENIPGKILKKTAITKNGYKGFDITNKTRRGDIQRYNILVTPFEVLVFKMSGNDDYVAGKEADEFFHSVSLKEMNNASAKHYLSAFGGFKARFPSEPYVSLNTKTNDRLDAWEFAAIDTATGNAYTVWKKSIINFEILEEDSFDLALLEESIKGSEIIDKQIDRKLGTTNGYPSLDMSFALKNGGMLNTKAIIRAPHYYIISASSKKQNDAAKNFINSFALTDFKYGSCVEYIDTFFKFKVSAPATPKLDASIRTLLESAFSEELLSQTDRFYSYWPKNRFAVFKSDSTGEQVMVTVKKYPKYYTSRDSADFWRNELNADNMKEEFVLLSKEMFRPSATSAGYKYVFTDTNTSKKLIYAGVLQNARMYKLMAVTDTLSKVSDFINQFFSTFEPVGDDTVSVFTPKLETYFADLNSKDSITRKRAIDAASSIYFGPKAIAQLKEVINNLKFSDNDYFLLKTKFINELGYIDDSCCIKDVMAYLQHIYDQTADTIIFQNAVLQSLARLKTKESYAVLKDYLVQDPPVFENEYEYTSLFGYFHDTLSLSKIFFPEILQLTGVNDYKEHVLSLLRTMVDSGYLKAPDYESYYSQLYFDAKIAMKRQQSKDVRMAEKEKEKNDEDNTNHYRYRRGDGYNSINDHAVLLVPFYSKYPAIKKFFEKLLQSKDIDVRLNTAVLMLRNKLSIPDTTLISIAAKDEYRFALLEALKNAGLEQLYPAAYKQQPDIARSALIQQTSQGKFYDIQLLGKKEVQVKEKKGVVYFFKYRIKKEDDWKIGLSGIQPLDSAKVDSDATLVFITDRKLKDDEPEREQFEQYLKKSIFLLRKSAAHFYNEGNYGYGKRGAAYGGYEN